MRQLLKQSLAKRLIGQRATEEHGAPQSHISLKEEKLATGT